MNAELKTNDMYQDKVQSSTVGENEEIHSNLPVEQKVNSEIVDSHPLIKDKYILVERLGRGAQGTVYKAIDRNNNRPVAIKIFDLSDSSSIADWKAVELLRREVETLKDIQVDGIPTFIEFIEGNPCSYLVESYIEADSLQTMIDEKRRLSQEQIVSILKETLSILRTLHHQVPPVIHRDIKPSNIMVEMRENGVSVWLVDFGTVTASQFKTRASTIAGTFGYSAPEQFYGHSSPSSDIYALGMTIIHLITGVSPDRMELDGLTIEYNKYMPSSISNKLRFTLDKMVKPNPKERFQSADEVLDYMNRDHSCQSELAGPLAAPGSISKRNNSELYINDEHSNDTGDLEPYDDRKVVVKTIAIVGCVILMLLAVYYYVSVKVALLLFVLTLSVIFSIILSAKKSQ